MNDFFVAALENAVSLIEMKELRANIDKKDDAASTNADRLADRLRSRLIDGGFEPGEQISIRQIAEAEGTSMIPARDALRALVAEGGLEFRGRRMIAVPVPDVETLYEIRAARIALEGELAGRAFDRLASKADMLATLDREVDRAITSRDALAYMAGNRAFHFTIYTAAQAPVLQSLVTLLWLRSGPGMRIICEGFDGHLPELDQHRAAIAALNNKDCEGFRAAIQADIADGMDAMIAARKG